MKKKIQAAIMQLLVNTVFTRGHSQPIQMHSRHFLLKIGKQKTSFLYHFSRHSIHHALKQKCFEGYLHT
uniref:Uncharacterized protein n=1 Tax=Anguilla anguilla TaxID=7936 RepID=A0A0E9WUS6_ANGAN